MGLRSELLGKIRCLWDAIYSLQEGGSTEAFQLKENLSSDLTASITKYPSVTAVNIGLNDKVGKTGNETIAGNKTFSGTTSLFTTTLTGDLLPDTNASRSIGSASIRLLAIYSSSLLSNNALTVGSTIAAGKILFRIGTTTVFAGGFQATTGNAYFQSIGAEPADIASARLFVNSTTQGVLLPRMTTTQKLAIVSPVEGLEVYDLTLHKKCVFTGTVWETLTSA